MKSRAAAALVLGILISHVAAAEKKGEAKKELTREEIAKLGGFEPAPEAEMPAVIQLEMLVVSVPKVDALAITDRLKNPATIEDAYRALTASVQNKKAKLIACPSIETRSGNRCVAEIITEVRYAIEFQNADGKKAAADKKPEGGKPPLQQAPAAVGVVPTTFETRNAGVTFEAEPVLGPDGKIVDVQIAAQHVELLGWDTVDVEEKGALVTRIPQPRFHTNKVTTNTTLQVGQRVLAGVFESAKDPESMEIFILRAGKRTLRGN